MPLWSPANLGPHYADLYCHRVRLAPCTITELPPKTCMAGTGDISPDSPTFSPTLSPREF